MTLQVNGIDMIAAAQAAALVGGVISTLIIGLLVYLLVRPPRHVREARRRPIEIQEQDAEQMIQLMDRMEARLAVLERALDDHSGRPAAADEQKILEPADEGREDRRTK